MTVYRFGEFVLALDERKLTRHGEDLTLGARAFDLLGFLVTNRHRVVTKEELLDAVWPDIAVEESNLTVQVSTLRKSIGAHALATIPGRGYQFVLSVEAGDPVPALGNPAPSSKNPKILVLPFVNASNDPDQEYFSDGISDDLITDLSKIGALSVVARATAFPLKGQPIDVQEIARAMHLTHLLEGSVRKSGNRLRINARLIDATKVEPIWADRFDCDMTDIFAMQDEITQAIVAALRITLVPSERAAIKARPTDNHEAYAIFQLAQYHHTRFTLRNYQISSRLAQQAIEIDPNYDRAWALLAVSLAGIHILSSSSQVGLQAADRAIELNPELAEAFAAKGAVLGCLNRFDEALEFHQRSLVLDPDSFDVRFFYGRTLLFVGRYAEAAGHFLRAADLSKTALTPLTFLSMCYKATGQEENMLKTSQLCLARAERALVENPDDSYALAVGLGSLAHLGDATRAKEWSNRAKSLAPDDPVIDYNIACAMVVLGEMDAAIDALERCVPKAAPAAFANWMNRDPDLDPLRTDTRFRRLVSDIQARATSAIEPPV